MPPILQSSILVTGGTGYIGSHTLVALIEAGYNPVIVDNLVNSKLKVLERIAKIAGKKPPFYKIDLRDTAALDKVFRKHKITSVIHFAALKAVGESVLQPLRYYENNINGSLSLFRVMAERGVKKIIFSSSAAVYGDPAVVPIKENAPTIPTNPYAATKLIIENILRDIYKADPAWRIILLRYFNPVGAHPSGLIGEDPQGIPNNLVPYISQVAVGRRTHINIFGNNYPTKDGTGVRDYIHVMDLAEGHVAALRYCMLAKDTDMSFRPKGEILFNDAKDFSVTSPLRNDTVNIESMRYMDKVTSSSPPTDGDTIPFCHYGPPLRRRGNLVKTDPREMTPPAPPLAINLGTGRGYTVLEIIEAFARASGRKIPYKITKRRPGDIATCYARTALAKKLFGWKAKRNLADMCADAWRWQSQNPNGY